jgi:hypothetical protein
MKIQCFALLAVLLLTACSNPVTIDPPLRADAELDIFEAVFRHQFEDNASAVQQKAAAYFLVIRDEDPSPEFLARFAGHQPPVRPGSEFEVGKGLQFRVESLEWLDDGGVKVTGGYYEASLSASGNVYTLEPDGEEWEVTDDEMEWIS